MISKDVTGPPNKIVTWAEGITREMLRETRT